MTKVILNNEALSALSGEGGPVEVCNGAGATVGVFTPKVDRSFYGQVQIDISDDELSRREAEPGGRTWPEIRADLERMA